MNSDMYTIALVVVVGGISGFIGYWRGFLSGNEARCDLDFDKMVSPHQDLTLGDVLKMIRTFITMHNMAIEELEERKKKILKDVEEHGKSKMYTHKK